MVDTQRFAIWHPPTEAKKSAPVPIVSEQPPALNKNIENLVKDFKWNDNFAAHKSSPVPTSRPRIQSVSSYTRPSVAPQPIHLATHLSKTFEDESESTSSEEDLVKVPPVATRKFSSSSPPKPILSSTPVNSDLTNARHKQPEKVSFALPKDTPKENENSLSQPRLKSIEKPTSQGPKVISKQQSPPNGQFPEHSKQSPIPKKPVAATEAKKGLTPEPKPPMRSPPPIESRRITPPDPRKQEIPKPTPAPVPAFPSQPGPQPLAPVGDQGFVTHNGIVPLDDFLVHLQDEAFDSVKLSMMEASIRQFHLIAADADILLTRKLYAVKTPNVAGKRQELIQAHMRSMEAQASSLLTDLSALHDRLKEQHALASGGLFDVPVGKDGWERPFPSSTAPWKTPSPPVQSKSSDSWKPVPPPPKAVEVPKLQTPPSEPNAEPESTMPSFWKPSWDADLTQHPTLLVPPISRLATVEDVPDEDYIHEPAASAPVPVSNNAKPTQVPVQQPVPLKNQIPIVADEPTPIWGQPWRKGLGKPSVSNNSSNQATKSAQVSHTPPTAANKPPIPPPVTAPAPEPAPELPTTTSPPQTKPKTTKQLRAEKNRKGKNKAAVSAAREDVVEEKEVPTPSPQEPQPPVSLKTGFDAAIDNMVSTGNFQALEQFGLGWR